MSQADEGLSTHLAALQELIESFDERIEKIEEFFPNGNQTSEKLAEERDSLQEIVDAIEDAKSSLGELF